MKNKLSFQATLMCALLLLTLSCSKKNTITVPSLITIGATNITMSTASSGGNITSDGGATVTNRGICWSMSPNPTILDSKTLNGSGTGTFTINITGLANNTLFYVRAFATNSVGTGYGDQKSFTTLQDVIPSFTVTATTVQLQGGGEGLQFYAKCTNTDVKMTKVSVTNPGGTQTIAYNLNGTNYVMNEVFMLEDALQAYLKEVGIWSFTFTGSRTSDGVSFSVTSTLQIP